MIRGVIKHGRFFLFGNDKNVRWAPLDWMWGGGDLALFNYGASMCIGRVRDMGI